MINGKQLRIKKLLPNGKAVFLALDHGFSMGPIKGLENLDSVISNFCDSSINGLIINYGAMKNLEISSLGNCKIPIIIHLSGSGLGKNAKEKYVLYDVKDALRMGADAVSLQINFDTATEREQIIGASKIIKQADYMGIPVLLMMYSKSKNSKGKLENIVRLGVELGADLIKIDIGGDMPLLQNISRNSKVPILIAGGELKNKETELKKSLSNYLKHGAVGISIGRNIFQSNNPKSLMSMVCEFVHNYEK
ncbi:MAG: hypothetical protein KAS02_01875 [Candidatus Pacebacteria bacterium]|nr:hypothetical protein [Candidatus Paceibacterota bacterium]